MASRIKVIIITICNIKITSSNMSGNLIAGIDSQITDFPHSAYLAIECDSNRGSGYFSCGSSIVNQAILLTAGHCVVECKSNVNAFAVFGHRHKDKGLVASVSLLKVHESYVEGLLSNDIALVLLKKDLELNENVGRVLLVELPLLEGEASVAGWGKINELSNDLSDVLKSTRQVILPTSTCLFTLNNPDGTFCADSKPGTGYPSSADSGSALVMNKHIQIGLVSYMDPNVSKKTTVYTSISYFHDWIKYNSRKLYCKGRKRDKKYVVEDYITSYEEDYSNFINSESESETFVACYI